MLCPLGKHATNVLHCCRLRVIYSLCCTVECTVCWACRFGERGVDVREDGSVAVQWGRRIKSLADPVPNYILTTGSYPASLCVQEF